ncbi:uncharacterized protein Tco025E_00362, partial [Trypanosoma conorhini]
MEQIKQFHARPGPTIPDPSSKAPAPAAVHNTADRSPQVLPIFPPRLFGVQMGQVFSAAERAPLQAGKRDEGCGRNFFALKLFWAKPSPTMGRRFRTPPDLCGHNPVFFPGAARASAVLVGKLFF